MNLPKRARDISPFIVMEVLEKAQEMESIGIDIIHLEVGEPDFEVPESVIIASNIAMRTGYTHYTHSLGDAQLRKTISRDYRNKYGVNVDPDQIIITSGSSPAIHLILSVLMEIQSVLLMLKVNIFQIPLFLLMFALSISSLLILLPALLLLLLLPLRQTALMLVI